MIKGLHRFVAWAIGTAFLRPGRPVNADAGNPHRGCHMQRTRVGADKQSGSAEQLAELEKRGLWGEKSNGDENKIQ